MVNPALRTLLISAVTVKPVNNDHSRDATIVVDVDRWTFMFYTLKLLPENSGRCRKVVVAIRGLSIGQVWLHGDVDFVLDNVLV